MQRDTSFDNKTPDEIAEWTAGCLAQPELNEVNGFKLYCLPGGRLRLLYCFSIPMRVRHPRIPGKYCVILGREEGQVRYPLAVAFGVKPMEFIIEAEPYDVDVTSPRYAELIAYTLDAQRTIQRNLNQVRWLEVTDADGRVALAVKPFRLECSNGSTIEPNKEVDHACIDTSRRRID